MSNLDLWNKLSRPPAEALKTIKGGRLSGMTDVNPQWRLKVMTEVFGPCGQGWTFTIDRLWTEPGPNGIVMCFAQVTVCAGGAGIPGVGGSTLVADESKGLHANDEGYKMAVTDALSTALKTLGVAADIYAGLWDGTKYRDSPQSVPSGSARAVVQNAFDSLTPAEQKEIQNIADCVMAELDTKGAEAAVQLIEEQGLDNADKLALWARLGSKERAALKAAQKKAA